MEPQGQQPDYSRPVAYDEHGRPLYAHPPVVNTQPQAQVQPVPPIAQPAQPQASIPQFNQSQTQAVQPRVQAQGAAESVRQLSNPDIRKLHEQSVAKYSILNLSEGEYVITTLRRHPIGMISIWAIVALAILITLFLPAMYYGLGIDSVLRLSPTATAALGLVLLAMIVLAIAAGAIATYVYESNRFILTNENVTQRIQGSLFSKKIQTISLGSIEDVSYRRTGIIQTILNYGSIRLSTEGEETTYRFNYAFDPEGQVHMINDAMEAFRESHPQNNGSS